MSAPDYSHGFRIDKPNEAKPRPTVVSSAHDELARFGDPPPSSAGGASGPGRRQAFIELLKDHPGEWAEYLPPAGKHGWSGGIKNAINELDREHVETVQRTITSGRGEGKLRIWARWVP